MEIDNENVVQAIVLMDTFNSNFSPILNNKPLALLPVAGVRLIEYSLEALALGGVGEAILFCSKDGLKIKEYLEKRRKDRPLWSATMDVQVKMCDSCQTMGDVMREIDAAALLRGPFVLTAINSVTNINFASLLELQKQKYKKDKDAAMTLVFNQVDWENPLMRSDNSILLAADGQTNRILFYKKYTSRPSEKTVGLPLKLMLNHSEMMLHHNLVDPLIVLCSPSVPPLFSDNFDMQTLDAFVSGILRDDEYSTSSLYYTLVKPNQYAAAVTDWKSYQTISRDILHNWVYPLTIETGSFYQDNHFFLGNHNFAENSATLSRSCSLVEDVLVSENAQIKDNTVISKSIIGKNCIIGNNVTIKECHIMDNVIVKDNCKIIKSFIDENSVVEENCVLEAGVIICADVKVVTGSMLRGSIVEADKRETKALISVKSETGTDSENDSIGCVDDDVVCFDSSWSESESCYSSAGSDDDLLDNNKVPQEEDIELFFAEVVDSLARGYEEKVNCDHLILEINSSRYAYNIQLNEVNVVVVRAILNIPVLGECENVIVKVKQLLKFFRPILLNYIKYESAKMDCMRGVEKSCEECEWFHEKCGYVVHMLYDAEIVCEDVLKKWLADLKARESPLLEQTSLIKFFEWLEDASEEESDEESE